MKLLRVKASNFKNCSDDFTIDFIAKSKKTSEDLVYELQKVTDELYVYNTMAFVGKNASGKTTAIELLDCCYSILGDFCVENKKYKYNNINLEIIFYHDGYVYKYCTKLMEDTTFGNKAVFAEQALFSKKYFKSYVSKIYEEEGFNPVENIGELPEDTSIVFFVLKKKETRAVYFNCDGEGVDTYQLMFKALKKYNISIETLASILKIFDTNISSLSMIDDHNYRLEYNRGSEHSGKDMVVSDKELIHFLSSGTTKGMLLYTFVVASVKYGFDLLIDEVENHFHKTLVENMVSLYKDKAVNKHNATMIFTTHYCEILDLFNRQDNIWISKSEGTVYLENMYQKHNIRTELMKSKQFYNNVFDTSVNYEDLMSLKRELMKV